MGKTLSFGKGKGNIRHNNRDYETPNVDHDRVQDNVYLVQQPLEDAYQECYGRAIEEYNAKQKRSDRKKSICGYMDEIKRNQANRNGEKLFYEQVIGIGDMHDTGIVAHPEDAQTTKAILLDYFKEWQERNPNLHVFNAVLHMDEATPHLHVDYIPVGHGYKQGLQARNSLTRAFENMGIDSAKSKDDNATIHWQERERARIAEIAQEHGVEIESLGIKRDDYTISDYKALVRDEKQALKQTKAVTPKRVNLPFGMALETNRTQVDKALQRKAEVKKHAETYKQATKEAENVTERAVESLKAVKGIEVSLEAQKADLEHLKRSVEQEHDKSVSALQAEKERYHSLYLEQLLLNQENGKLRSRVSELTREVDTLKAENRSLKAEIGQIKQEIEVKVQEATKALKEQLEAFKERMKSMAETTRNITRAVSWMKEAFNNDKLHEVCNAVQEYSEGWLEKDGFPEMAEGVYTPELSKEIKNYMQPEYPEKVRFIKNGKSEFAFWDDKGNCWGGREMLQELRNAGVKILDPHEKLGRGISR